MNVYVFVHVHLSGQECLGKGSVKGKGHFVLRQQSRLASVMGSKVSSLGSD